MTLPFPILDDDGAAPVLETAPQATQPTDVTRHWVRSQVVSASRHLERLRPFQRAWFGEGQARPRTAHIEAVNTLIGRERAQQKTRVAALQRLGTEAASRPSTPALSRFAGAKDAAYLGTRRTEGIWHFYDALFAQRKGVFAKELGAMDRIALDCYQAVWMGLGKARSLPSPPPFSYVEPSGGPATWRRGVRVPDLARGKNPFPLIRLPFHRIVNPWSLGAMPHEVGHNIHADLGLWQVTPKLLERRLTAMGLPASAVQTWARWHKEIYADLIGVLLIGPAYVDSLMDVVGKGPARVAAFRPDGAHPTSYLRPFISTALLRRTGFAQRARAIEAGWRSLYGPTVARRVPAHMRQGFPQAAEAVVQELTFRKMAAYGGKSLVEVVCFIPRDAATVTEAAARLAKGTNPGILPSRFLISAAREALRRDLAPPETIARNFYTTLTGS